MEFFNFVLLKIFIAEKFDIKHSDSPELRLAIEMLQQKCFVFPAWNCLFVFIIKLFQLPKVNCVAPKHSRWKFDNTGKMFYIRSVNFILQLRLHYYCILRLILYFNLFPHIYIYIYIYMCACIALLFLHSHAD